MSPSDKSSQLEAVLPLTALQEAMLMVSLAHQTEGVYLSQVVLELSAVPDPALWWQAWREVCDRHQALRSAFLVAGRPTPVCAVLRSVELDADSVSPVEDLDQWLQQDRSTPFNIESPPLHRHRLLRDVNDDSGACCHVWTFHHAVCDGWSTQIIIDEVFRLYQSAVDAGALVLPPAPSLKRWFESVHTKAAPPTALAQLRAQRVAMVEPTPLPGAIVQPSGLEPATLNSCSTDLSETDWQMLKASAKKMNVSPASIVSAAWALVLAGLGRVDEVSFGVTFAARDNSLSENLVGMIMHTLPLTVPLDGQASVVSMVGELNKRVHRMAEAGPASWQQLRELRSEALGDSADAVPFHSLISFENVYEAAGAAGDGDSTLTAKSTRYIDQSNLPFSLIVIPANRLQLKAYYHDGAVSAGLAERLLSFLLQALKKFTSASNGSVAQWHYLTEDERQQVVFEFARSGELGKTQNVLSRLATNTTQIPDRVAIRQGASSLNYRSLWQQARAVQLAVTELEAQYVVLIAPARPELVSAMFGVLMSGRAYVPMDADWPLERIRQLVQRLSESGSVAIIADDVQAYSQPSVFDPAVTVLGLTTAVDFDARRAQVEALAPLPVTIPDQRTAYVMFTSGSSGEPKAVSVSHGALAASTASRDLVYPVSPQRFLLLSSIAFDSSVVGIYWTLCSGGELVLPNTALATALEDLGQIVCHNRITHTLCLPSVHSLLLSMLSARHDHELASVIVAGEECPMSLLQQHERVLPEVELWNEYGPTESTVWCSGARLLSPSEPGLPYAVSIGKPVAGTVIRLLDYHDRPVPVGFGGELLVGGRLLADGYLNDSAKTNQHFVQDPFRSDSRMYRTGDLARWDESGNLEYRGRLDQQIKIRGVRVEPADVEAALAQLNNVAEVCVMQVGAAHDNEKQVLAAALVLSSSHEPEQGWASLAADRLPAAMVPQHFVQYANLPRLSNGKLDRRRLQQDLKRDLAKRENFGTPQRDLDDVQSRILRQVAHVLPGLAPDHRQSLFDAGLDSLTAVRLLLAVNQELGSRLSIADVYANPSVEALAAVSRIADDGEWLRTVAMSPQHEQRPLFFAYGNGQRVAQMVPAGVGVHWLIHGQGETVMPIDSFSALAQRHIEQMREIQAHGPYRLGGFSLGALLVIEIARQLIDAGERVEWLGLVDPTSPDHFATRGRHIRLRAMLSDPGGLRLKAAYLRQFLFRLPEFVRQRGQRDEITGSDLVMPELSQTDTAKTLTHHDAIVDRVKQTLAQFNYAPIKCPLALFRVKASTEVSAESLEWRDEAVFWAQMAQGRFTEANVVADGSHREFFKDASVEQAFRRWLAGQLEQ